MARKKVCCMAEGATHCKNEASKSGSVNSKLTSFFKKKLPASPPRFSPSVRVPSSDVQRFANP